MLGFGLLMAFDEPPLDVRSSAGIVPIAQALVAIPFVVRALAPAFAPSTPAPRGGGRAGRLACPHPA